MTVEFGSGARNVYKVNGAGVVLQSGSLEDSFVPARTNYTIRELYDRAVDRGLSVTLHTRSEVSSADEEHRRRRAASVQQLSDLWNTERPTPRHGMRGR